MKKVMRFTALLLALVMCLAVTVFAEEPVNSVENTLATVTGADGATVEFVRIDEEEGKEEKIRVTYTDETDIQPDNYYLVMVIEADENGNYGAPGEDNILFIDQTTGDANHSVSFEVFTSKVEGRIEDSVVLIYGLKGEKSYLVAAIINAKYILGDVDDDGDITAADATKILRFVANIPGENWGGNQGSAADVDHDGDVTAADATKILRFVANLEDL